MVLYYGWQQLKYFTYLFCIYFFTLFTHNILKRYLYYKLENIILLQKSV